ncbi:hypothetical protein RB653_005996 [Dictyostelium firmibasis]|uniref:SART-1 family protein n=1 Tax=Dictyostelium firmibasis TaxID=79012 RepID=A0AAN7UDP7_9MYCE
MSETNPTNVITNLSIEETNKIRISLGLKPLKVEEPEESKSKSKPTTNSNNDTFEVLDTINKLKKRRELNSKLVGKSIAEQLLEGENEDEEDDISNWVNKSRENDKQKQIEKKKLLLNKKQQQQQQKQKHYNQSDLKGIKVGNDIKNFEDENEHILTLQDSNVLDDDSQDVLINVNLSEKERREKQLQANKKKSKFDKYDDFGEHKGGILSDYSDDDDDKIDNSGFILGNEGKVDKNSLTNQNGSGISLKDQAKKNLESYNMEDNSTTSILSSFYTQEEMERFKKNRQSNDPTKNSTVKEKKKKKLRKKSTTSDLLNELDATTSSDLGSRNSRSITEKEKKEFEDQTKREENYQRAKDKANEISKQTYSSDYYEEAEDEDFYKSLTTSKKAPILQEKSIVDKIVNNKKNEIKKQQENENDHTNNLEEITINPTSEFVRSLNPDGLISNYRSTTINNNTNDETINKKNDENNSKDEEMKNIDEENDDNKENDDDNDDDDDDDDDDNDDGNDKNNNKEEEDYNKYKEKEKKYNNLTSILPEEPLVSGSVSAALRLFAQKGDLQPNPVTNQKKRGINYDNDESTVIEHKDEFGRIMNRKQAFVKMSQVFHGKKSGKNKMEKRKRLYEEELKKMKMDSTDTPLGMVKSFQNYQEKSNSPYLVLSGGSITNILKQNNVQNNNNNNNSTNQNKK